MTSPEQAGLLSLRERLIARALYVVGGFLRMKFIRRDEDTDYMERYYIGRRNGRVYYLHRFVYGDVQEEPHNHPWSESSSLVITGGYIEETFEITRSKKHRDRIMKASATARELSAGARNTIRRDTVHRIVSVVPETWTLFSHTDAEVGSWGFLEKRPGKPYMTIRPHVGDSASDWTKTAPVGLRSGRVRFGSRQQAKQQSNNATQSA
jgi:hypothetical protein